MFAMKIIKCKTLEDVDQCKNEIEIIEDSDHDNIIKLEDVFASKAKNSMEIKIVMILELAEDNLHSKIEV